MTIIHTLPDPKWPKPQTKREMDKLRNILPFGEMDRTDGKYAYGEIIPMTEKDKKRDREEIAEYMKENGICKHEWMRMQYAEEEFKCTKCGSTRPEVCE
jgi:hypothetical protein